MTHQVKFLSERVYLLHEICVDLDLWRLQSRGFHELELGLSGDLPSKPEEGLLKVVVGFCRDIVILRRLL